MRLRLLAPSVPGFLCILGAIRLLTAHGRSYKLAALLLLTSGVLFSAVALVDAVKAKRSAGARTPETPFQDARGNVAGSRFVPPVNH